jgi:hypothetical protein
MAWQSRPAGKFYYRSIRVNGKVRSVYVGTGAEAEAAFAEVERRRVERCTQQRHRDHLQTRTTTPEQINFSGSLLADASFLIAGYWQHAHGAWRRINDRQDN